MNLAGAFLCARAVYAGMCEAGGGSIVSMSSIRVPLGMGGNLHYTSSKAALIGFTRTLARDIGVDGIRVNALVVGAILTSDEDEYGPQEEIDAQCHRPAGDPATGHLRGHRGCGCVSRLARCELHHGAVDRRRRRLGDELMAVRIGVVSVMQETNTFAVGETTFADFEANGILRGAGGARTWSA